MALVKPFKAIRPSVDKVHLVASRSIDAYPTEELKNKLRAEPYSFLHIINPDHSDRIPTLPGSIERLQKVKNKFAEFITNKIFIKDTSPAFYIYRQIKENVTYTGIIGCAAVDDYYNGIIKKHEQTLTEREEKLKDYLDICDFNAEPVLFCYPSDTIIDNITDSVIQTAPLYDFVTNDAVKHRLWKIDNPAILKEIENRFDKIRSIYIADGHHRSASSALLGKERKQNNPGHTGNEPYNFYLGIFFPETQLRIFDFNRVIADTKGLSAEELINKISDSFNVEEKKDLLYKPNCLHNFSMYLDKKWYSLTAKQEICTNNDPVEILDAQLLSKYILAPILNITDLRTDKRIKFVPGIKGAEELKNKVDSGKYKVAFGLFPVTMQQLKKVADAEKIMPPKSTWVEPKMRSGLTIYSLSE